MFIIWLNTITSELGGNSDLAAFASGIISLNESTPTLTLVRGGIFALNQVGMNRYKIKVNTKHEFMILMISAPW